MDDLITKQNLITDSNIEIGKVKRSTDQILSIFLYYFLGFILCISSLFQIFFLRNGGIIGSLLVSCGWGLLFFLGLGYIFPLYNPYLKFKEYIDHNVVFMKIIFNNILLFLCIFYIVVVNIFWLGSCNMNKFGLCSNDFHDYYITGFLILLGFMGLLIPSKNGLIKALIFLYIPILCVLYYLGGVSL